MSTIDQQAVLFANEAFYRAFAARDLAAMDELWARDLPVACIHPGWGSLTDRRSVMKSWKDILGSASSPAISCRDARAFLLGSAAFVLCFEVLDGGYLIATNIFSREGGVWKLVHHQAGPTTQRPAEEEEPVGAVH